MQAQICGAIRSRNIIEFDYKGLHRVVEPYTFGMNSKNNNVLSGYQIGGRSSSQDLPCWGLFDLDDISNMVVAEDKFIGNNQKYRRNDSRMVQIYCEL